MLRKMFPFILSCLILLSCAEKDVMVSTKIDQRDKTIQVPPGSRGLTGGIKNALSKNGWELLIYGRGPTISEMNNTETQIKRYDTFNARYKLIMSFTRDVGPACKYDLSSWTNYEISVIDNKSGKEILSMSGRDNCGTIVDTFVKALDLKQ
jgi:hypothetical protein